MFAALSARGPRARVELDLTAWSRVALAPLHLSGAHVNGALVLLMPIVGRPVAPERGQRRGQTPIQFAATSF